MRDILLIVILGGGALYALYRPWVGAMLWTWVSLMSPHVEFGWAAAHYQFGLLIAIATLLGLLFTQERQNPLLAPSVVALLAFVVWTVVTLPFSIYFDASLQLFQRSMKIFLMLFVTLSLLDTRKKLEVFIWVNVLSIGFYGFKGGIFTIMTGGEFRVWGPGGFIYGNNELAVALIATIPLMRYLQLQQSRRWIRWLFAATMVLSAVAAIGTYSRGALLAMAAMGFFLWLKTEKKAAWGVAFFMVAAATLAAMPEHWWARMDTIGTYEQDDSALGRINAWINAFNLANDRIFGGGFMIYRHEVFARYAPIAEARAAHSIYFQVLGEHGWIGLALFLSIGVLTWRQAGRLIRQAKQRSDLNWARDLGAMVQVSIIGFGVGGAFLSLAYFDLPYNAMAMVALALHLSRHSPVPAASAEAAKARSLPA